jgi:prepilin-type processing-associated H-X9-DG protein
LPDAPRGADLSEHVRHERGSQFGPFVHARQDRLRGQLRRFAFDQIDGGPSSFAAATTYAWPNTDQFTGVCSMRSEVRDRDITDGTSNTYYAGEKYLDPRLYTTGTDLGDNEDAFVGFDNDICRTASLNYPPMNDTPGIQNTFGFGSGHPAGLNMAFCDGSVRRVSYDIDPETHRRLANRRDGLFIDAGQLGR